MIWIRNTWVKRTQSADKGGHLHVRSAADVDQVLDEHGRAVLDMLDLVLKHEQLRMTDVARFQVHTACDIKSRVNDRDICDVFSRILPVLRGGKPSRAAAFA